MSHALVILAATTKTLTFGGCIFFGILGVTVFFLGLYAVATQTYPMGFVGVRLIWRLFGHEYPPLEGTAAVLYGLASIVAGPVLVAVSVCTTLDEGYLDPNKRDPIAEEKAEMDRQMQDAMRRNTNVLPALHGNANQGNPGAQPNAAAPAQPAHTESPEEIERQRRQSEADRIQREQEEKAREQERLAREREERGPDPGDPQYYEKLAERMLSANSAYRRDAMQKLLRTDRSQVESAETRKKIARAFRQVAQEGQDGFERDEAVKGLVRWAGKYSVPTLLAMLDENHSHENAEVYKALGDLQDRRAAAPVAHRLADHSERSMASKCLRRMGAIAEDAVLDVLSSPDTKTRVSAIEVLSEIGTRKSLPPLRTALRNRNARLRFAANQAIQSIVSRSRQKAEADGEEALSGSAADSD
jgi:hypothetical protein